MVLATTVGILPFATALAATVTSLTMTATSLSSAFLGIVFRCFAQFLWHREFEHFTFDKLLNGSKARLVVHRDESDGTPLGTGTSRAADTVHIVLTIAGNVVVDDKANVVDVDATRHDVGSHEDIDTTALELVHHHIALCLVEIAVHLAHIELHTLEL